MLTIVLPDYCLCQSLGVDFTINGLEIVEAFAQVLLRHRKAKGLTHEALAERSGLHPTTLSLLERAKRQPSVTTIFLLAEGLEVEPDVLVRDVRKLRPKIPR